MMQGLVPSGEASEDAGAACLSPRVLEITPATARDFRWAWDFSATTPMMNTEEEEEPKVT